MQEIMKKSAIINKIFREKAGKLQGNFPMPVLVGRSNEEEKSILQGKSGNNKNVKKYSFL